MSPAPDTGCVFCVAFWLLFSGGGEKSVRNWRLLRRLADYLTDAIDRMQTANILDKAADPIDFEPRTPDTGFDLQPLFCAISCPFMEKRYV